MHGALTPRAFASAANKNPGTFRPSENNSTRRRGARLIRAGSLFAQKGFVEAVCSLLLLRVHNVSRSFHTACIARGFSLHQTLIDRL
jgi:hypothetical protein